MSLIPKFIVIFGIIILNLILIFGIRDRGDSYTPELVIPFFPVQQHSSYDEQD